MMSYTKKKEAIIDPLKVVIKKKTKKKLNK